MNIARCDIWFIILKHLSNKQQQIHWFGNLFIFVFCSLYTEWKLRTQIYLINVNHAIDEGPEQRVRAESTKESIRQQRFSWNEIFLPACACFDNQETEESAEGNQIEDES